MSAWFTALLGLVAAFASLFLLVWLVRRAALPRAARWLGWASVGVTAVAFFASFWLETAMPYLRAGRPRAFWLSWGQMLAMLGGLALLVFGAVRVLRAWLAMDWVLDQGLTGFLQASPKLAHVRRPHARRERWTRAKQLLGQLAQLPGLGEMLLGLAVLVLAGQLLEPDPGWAVDARLVRWALVAMGAGLAQWAWRGRGR